MKKLLLGMALAVFICLPSLDASAAVLDGGKMRVTITAEPFVLTVLDASGRTLLESEGPVSFNAVSHQRISRLVLWWRWTRGISGPWVAAGKVVNINSEPEQITVDLSNKQGGPALVRMTARFTDTGALRVETEVLDRPDVNRIRMRFVRDGSDRYYGMGERFNAVEHSGEMVRVWAEEGGLGLSYLSEIIPRAPFNPFPHGPDTTYYPVPFFLDPDKGYGFLLDDVHYSEFDFGKSNKKYFGIENWSRRLDFMVFYGPSALEVIEAQTAYTGRIEVPPAWAFAPMAAVVEGEARVLEVAEGLRREGIPTSAIWTESWWWRKEWEVNRELFPHYEDMNAKLHEDGFRALGYYQPYVSLETESYREGDAQGYFIKDKNGVTYPFSLGLWKKVQLDLTNPAAAEWWKEKFFAKSEEMGIDGWMHDFGEHVAPDAVMDDGRSGWDVHNEYSLSWAKLGHDFWSAARPDGDYCFYVRGGYTGTQRYANVMWTGDQNSNFEKLDGLPANIPGILSVGISGHPIGATDIAGYNCFVNKSADRELFMRWTELGALLPVMRNHRGNDEICDHWEFDRDRETLEHYKKYAVLHTALFPYLYTLAYEAAAHGWPIVRHLSLHFPDDPATWRLDYQYLLGDRVLVAPVLKRGAREWEVYFPAGEWVHWWSGQTYSGPGRSTVPADLGEAPLFVRSGKVLPVFDGQIDTLVKEDRPDLAGFDDANGSMKIIFYGTGQDDYTLWDGTEIECTREEDAAGRCDVSNAPLARRYVFEFK